MALAAPRKAIRRDGRQFVLPVAANAVIHQGGLVLLAGAYARAARAGQGGDAKAKAADAATYRTVGVAQESVTGSAADGGKTVSVEAGCWAFKNSAGVEAVTIADRGRNAYVVDDETVARTDDGQTRAVAGRIVDVDADGVWIDTGLPGVGPSIVRVPFTVPSTELLAGTPIELISPVAGALSKGSAIVQTAVTTGGDVTFAVGVTAVDGLTLTIADGATKGSIVSDVPTAGHASTIVAVGDRIQIIPGAAFNTAGAIAGFLEITC